MVRRVDRTSSAAALRDPAVSIGRRRRRNRAEALVRRRVEAVEDLFVLRSSWHRNGSGPEPLVAVVARNGESRDAAREVLADIAGFSADSWSSLWTRLSLDDWMIWIYPERALS
jgi:hypothetical protein